MPEPETGGGLPDDTLPGTTTGPKGKQAANIQPL